MPNVQRKLKSFFPLKSMILFIQAAPGRFPQCCNTVRFAASAKRARTPALYLERVQSQGFLSSFSPGFSWDKSHVMHAPDDYPRDSGKVLTVNFTARL